MLCNLPGDYLLKKGDPESLKRRAVLTCSWLACGRSGEVGNTRWKNSAWDIDEGFLYLDWNENKTGREKPMTFVSDATTDAIDFFHCLACFYMFYGGTTANVESQNWVFPFLAGLEAGGGPVITDYLKKLVEFIKQLPPDVCGTSLRVGATNVMVNNIFLELVHAVLRGKWSCVV